MSFPAMTEPGTKLCTYSGHEGANPVPVTEFGRDPRKRSGLRSWCRKCMARTEHERYIANGDAIRKRARENPRTRKRELPRQVGALRLSDPLPDDGHVLTWRQRLVLRAIAASVAEHGYSPAFAEIGRAAHISSRSSVWFQVRSLKEKGYLVASEDAAPRRRPSRWRESDRARATDLECLHRRRSHPEIERFSY